jgi:nucleotide-binding universal stress UspA family protein
MSNAPHSPKSIVVGVDAEGRADRALDVAVELARAFGATLFPIHAAPILPFVEPGAHGPTLVEALRSRLHARIDSHLQPLDPRPELQVAQGDPGRLLVECAREHGDAWIVLGPHHKKGWLDFGSTARAVLAHAPSAVWVQPEAARPIREILVPLDLSVDSLDALAIAIELAAERGARITALHCFVPPFVAGAGSPEEAALAFAYPIEELRARSRTEFQAQIQRTEWRGVAHSEICVEGDAAREILARADAADLIVMGTHGRTGLSAWFLGNVAHTVLLRTQKPVLAVRNARRNFALHAH